MNKKLLLTLALIALLIFLLANLTIWEDGSFRLLSFTGCLPGGLCN